jgi:sodium transport system permease protein
VCVFAIAGFTLNLLGFSVVLANSGIYLAGSWLRLALLLACGLFPLPLFAASVQLLISTVCRGVKEAQTYLSMVVFLPMGLGLFLVFFPAAAQGWFRFLPLAGQRLQLESLLKGSAIPLHQPIVLGCFTAALALLILLVAANRLHRDEVIYGN